MSRLTIALIIVIILLVILILRNHSRNKALCVACLGGFWCAPPEFCQEAGLNSLILYLVPDSGISLFDISMRGSICVDNDAPIPMTVCVPQKVVRGETAVVSFHCDDNAGIFPLPTKQPEMRLDVSRGKMILLDAKKREVVALLYKDYDLESAAAAEN
ncbi:MAG: hypothetical protein M0R33_15375 [Methylomonas sp.]|jgi:hypothetical protein|uniref:hypothetical protein n=1 Tax=Methylomonas sp. TaxID=418 RepID=UPI0025FE2A59|nr:hypothetical protein [Methylomonas sp.]MCK9607823.1 hypothetical protein [Methylomonas sp.]